MNIEFNEDIYARFKSLGLTDTEMCYALGISVNQLSYYKQEMDIFELDDREEIYLESGYVKRFHKRMHRKYYEKKYAVKEGLCK